jgi:hypothetical protein
MRKSDRIAIEDAAYVLKAIVDRAQANPEFAQHISNLLVPGGKPIIHFLSAISGVATRYPTDWVGLSRRKSEEAA